MEDYLYYFVPPNLGWMLQVFLRWHPVTTGGHSKMARFSPFLRWKDGRVNVPPKKKGNPSKFACKKPDPKTIRDQKIHRVTTLNHSPSSRPSAAVAWELPSSGLPGGKRSSIHNPNTLQKSNIDINNCYVWMELPFPKHHFGALVCR